jgi:hypothetical protein
MPNKRLWRRAESRRTRPELLDRPATATIDARPRTVVSHLVHQTTPMSYAVLPSPARQDTLTWLRRWAYGKVSYCLTGNGTKGSPSQKRTTRFVRGPKTDSLTQKYPTHHGRNEGRDMRLPSRGCARPNRDPTVFGRQGKMRPVGRRARDVLTETLVSVWDRRPARAADPGTLQSTPRAPRALDQLRCAQSQRT